MILASKKHGHSRTFNSSPPMTTLENTVELIGHQMKSNKTVLSFRVSQDVRQAVEKAAAKERRPIAHWLELLLEEALKQKGFLKVPSC
jgi:hypothetical protein